MAIPTLATYGGTTFAPGFLGQVSEAGPVTIRSLINENATSIEFGAAVTKGTTTAAGLTDRCKPISASGDVPIGIAVRNAGSLIASPANVVNYAQYNALPVMTTGVVYCQAGETVAEGDTCVVVVAAPTTIGTAGAGGAAANGTTRMAINATWLDPVVIGSIGRVHINTNT